MNEREKKIKKAVKEISKIIKKNKKVKARDPKRIKRILKKIEKIWTQYPTLRLCQLIGNCFDPEDLYNKEDTLLEKRLKETYENVDFRG